MYLFRNIFKNFDYFQISSTMKPEMLVTIREYNPADPDPVSKAWDATQNKVRIFWPFRAGIICRKSSASSFLGSFLLLFKLYSSVFGKDMSAKPICQIRLLSSKIEHFYDILSRYITSFQEKFQCMKNRRKYFLKDSEF